MRKTFTSLPTIYPTELAQKGSEIYTKLKEKLESDSHGKFVAIEVDSGKCFVADRLDGVLRKAKTSFPHKIFYVLKVGYPGAINVSWSFQKNSYGSILR